MSVIYLNCFSPNIDSYVGLQLGHVVYSHAGSDPCETPEQDIDKAREGEGNTLIDNRRR